MVVKLWWLHGNDGGKDGYNGSEREYDRRKGGGGDMMTIIKELVVKWSWCW
jgi:hypothetical protein